MAIDEDVNAGDLLQQVDGAVAGGLSVNAQVAQADDVVAAVGFQGVHLGLGAVEHLLGGQEGDSLDLVRVGLGGGLRGVKAENADLFAIGGGEGGLIPQGGGVVIPYVGGQDGEVRFPGQGLQIGVAVVKLVVAGGGHVVAGQVHKLNGGLSLGGAHGGVSLDKVAGIRQQHIGAGRLVGLLQGGDFGILADGPVDIVGVQNNDVTGQVLFRLCGSGGNGQGQHHDQCQEERGKLLP